MPVLVLVPRCPGVLLVLRLLLLVVYTNYQGVYFKYEPLQAYNFEVINLYFKLGFELFMIIDHLLRSAYYILLCSNNLGT